MTWWLLVLSLASFAVDEAPTCAPALDGSKLLLIVGPSGVGKTTLVKTIQKIHPEPLHFVVGVTTRGPRPGEVDGVDYHFWSDERYDEASSRGRFVTTFRGPRARYGDLSSEFDPFLIRGVPVLCIVDLEGARTIKARYRGSRIVRLALDEATVAARLAARNTEDAAERRERIASDLVYVGDGSDVDLVLGNDDVNASAEALVRLLRPAGNSG